MTLLTDDKAVIWQGDDLSLVATRQPGGDLVRQLEETWFGSQGVRYRKLAVGEHLGRFTAPAFLELRSGDRLVGTYVIEAGRLASAGIGATGWYRGLLTVNPEFQGRGLGRLVVDRTFEWLDAHASGSAEASISWGCIERNNERSLRLLQSIGAIELGTLETRLVYRQWPREQVAIDVLGADAREEIRRAVDETYADCGLTAAIPDEQPFYAVTRESRIVAGAHAAIARVDMERLGGWWDFMHDKLFRHVPPARRRFDPRNFTYLRLSNAVVLPGHEQVWKPLITTLAARFGVHMVMFAFDPRSRAHRLLQDAGVFGRFADATRQEVAMLATSWHVDRDTLAGIVAKPLGLGPRDA